MKKNEHTHQLAHHEEVTHDEQGRSLFGFWVYIMSDCLLFASIFATYAVLRNSTFDGPTGKELFSMPFVLTETFLLLASTFTYGLVTIFAYHKKSKTQLLTWMSVTFLLGAAFISMEIYEFVSLIRDGHGPQVSAFLSAFFVLVGTHGLHVFAGLIWMASVFFQVLTRPLTPKLVGNISMLGIFWHFLDIIWIFIFTIVYLVGLL